MQSPSISHFKIFDKAWVVTCALIDFKKFELHLNVNMDWCLVCIGLVTQLMQVLKRETISFSISLKTYFRTKILLNSMRPN